MTGARLTKTESADLNYLDHPAAATYFAIKEHEAYYRALKRVGPRRDFHSTLIPLGAAFVDLALAGDGERVLDPLIAATARAAAVRPDGGLLAEARAVHARGVELMGLTEPLTFESLKSGYRVAARRHHPDAGGSHDAMVAVNEAYTLLHELLVGRQQAAAEDTDAAGDELAASGGSAGPGHLPLVETTRDYVYVVGRLLLAATLDDWAVDEAFTWLERVTSDAWQRSAYASHPWERMNLAEPAGKLATRLAVAGRREDAQQALAVAREAARLAKAHGLSYDHFIGDAADVIAGHRRSQVVLNHPRQAENALRLGVIDRKRYAKSVEKFEATAREEGERERALAEQLSGTAFLPNLPADRPARGKVKRAGLVPEPGYYVTRVADLSDDQQAEYVEAFGAAPSLALVRKYTFVRLTSLLESMITEPAAVSPAAVERECSVLGSVHPGSGAAYAADVAAFARDVAAEEPAARGERLKLLRTLHERALAAGERAGVLRVSLAYALPSRFVELSPGYFETASLPLLALRHLVATGDPLADERGAAERAAWDVDLAKLDAPEVEALQDAAFAAVDSARDDPVGAARTIEEYVEMLLSLGRSMVHVQELQVGYWVDRLTIILVQLKRWDDGRRWLERYLALPERYRDRSSPSEEAAIRKRLLRCRDMAASP